MTQSSSPPPAQQRDESPIHLAGVVRWLPRWLRRYIPIGGNHQEDEAGKSLFGMTVFLLSESMIFVGFFLSYILLRTTVAEEWIPAGMQGPDASPSVVFNTVVLVSSSFVIYFAERSLTRGKLNQFRLLWLLTSAMGLYFLIGEAVEWAGLDFGLDTGLMGGTFYILTGFHGLHVATGVVLQMV
ncbi:MAG: heme-copper oxidase subunit III, partial [Phormidesmis sp.]